MIRAVLDANVWVSGLISRSGPPGEILDRWFENAFQVVISPSILYELLRVFQYPHIRARIGNEDLQRLISVIVETVDQSIGILELEILTIDPADNIYLACAVESGAEYLVTGNLKHFVQVVDNYRGVGILNPRDFLRIIKDIPIEGSEFIRD